MSNSNGKIKAPVNIQSDLGVVLGTGSGDIGVNIANGNINKWAIYKPVRDSHRGWVSPRNTLASLGFASIPYATTIQGLINLYDGGDNGWAYQRPRGASQGEYYRMADFCKIVGSGGLDTSNYGYNHYAKNPFGSMFSIAPTTQSRNYGTVTTEMARAVAAGDYPDTDLTIYDFNQILAQTLQMSYYGCVIKWPTNASAQPKLFGNDISFITTRGKEQLQYTFQMTPSLFQTLGEYTIYPCISNQALGFNVSLASGQRLYPIPGCSPVVLTVIDDYITISVVATVLPYTSGSSYTVRWNFNIRNDYDHAVTLTDVGARFRFSGKSYQDTMQSGEVEVSVGTVNIAAGSTYYYPGQGLSADQSLSNFDLSQLIVGAKYNNALKTGSRHFIAPVNPNLAI